MILSPDHEGGLQAPFPTPRVNASTRASSPRRRRSCSARPGQSTRPVLPLGRRHPAWLVIPPPPRLALEGREPSEQVEGSRCPRPRRYPPATFASSRHSHAPPRRRQRRHTTPSGTAPGSRSATTTFRDVLPPRPDRPASAHRTAGIACGRAHGPSACHRPSESSVAKGQ